MKMKLSAILFSLLFYGILSAQNSCEEDLVLSQTEPNSFYLYQVRDRITVHDAYSIPAGSQSDIAMKAGNVIVLKSRTTIYKGNRYLAKIEGCTCEETFTYSKFFTPNGDNVNNIWRVKNLEQDSFGSLYIFDRYGKIVYQVKDMYSGWDGTFNNVPLPATDYWFKLVFKDCYNNWTEYQSHFSLIR